MKQLLLNSFYVQDENVIQAALIRNQCTSAHVYTRCIVFIVIQQHTKQ